MKILLDYVFPISVIESIPAASTAFLKQVCVVAKPKSGMEGSVGTITECVNNAEVALLTDNTNCEQLFIGGMSKVFVLLSDDLNISAALLTEAGEFYTVLISDDFADADIIASAASLVKAQLTFTAKAVGYEGNDISIELLSGGTAGSEVVTVVGKKISVVMESTVSTTTQIKAKIDAKAEAAALVTVAIASGQGATAVTAFAEDNLEGGDGLSYGTFEGVIGVSSDDNDFLEDQAVIGKRCAFFIDVANGAKNMFFAFGKFLSNISSWQNQQYIEMPFDDAIDELGEANSLFDDKISFVIADDEFGKRLGLFAAGGKAIAAPYILKNLRVDMQSRALQWIAQNQPQYTLKEASLLETRLQEDVINSYISRGWIQSGSINITLEQDNFVASGDIEVPTPKALWRVANQMTETT